MSFRVGVGAIANLASRGPPPSIFFIPSALEPRLRSLLPRPPAASLSLPPPAPPSACSRVSAATSPVPLAVDPQLRASSSLSALLPARACSSTATPPPRTPYSSRRESSFPPLAFSPRVTRRLVGSVASCTHSSLAHAMALEKVEIRRNGDGEVVFDAYVAGPGGSPGVVVIQEWWGVDFETKAHANTLAHMGFRTLIPDLYRGKVALDEAEAQHLMGGLDWPGAVEDIAASVKWLKAHGSSKVGVTGFCMGGALALASAVLVEDVSAAVPFYGIPPLQLANPALAKAPVLGHFGEIDKLKGFSDVEAAKALEEKLMEAGVPFEICIYPGQGHAFMNASEEGIKRKVEGGNAPHDQAAVDLAWRRTNDWFQKYLT